MRKFIFCFAILFSVIMKAHEGGNFVESDMLASLQPGDKAALLVVHFGTTYPETRQRTIEAINRKIADAFPQLTIREAWTSRIVIKRMAARGEKIPVPAQALQQLMASTPCSVLFKGSRYTAMETLIADILASESQ